MIFFLLLVLVSFVYSAVVFDDEEKQSDSSTKYTRLISDIYCLNDDMLVFIGTFLECPQTELSVLDTRFNRLFMEEHRYSEFLAERHGIDELKGSQSDKDLAVFKQFAFIKDPIYLYVSIHLHLFKKNTFSENEYGLLRFLIRVREGLGFPDPASSTEQLAFISDDPIYILQNYSDYDFLLEYVAKNGQSFRKFCFRLDMRVGKAFMEHVLNIDEVLYGRIEHVLLVEFDQSHAALNVYKHLWSIIEGGHVNNFTIASAASEFCNFLLSSFLAGVPEEWYLPLVMTLSTDMQKQVIKYIFNKCAVFESSEDNERIHNALNRILNRLSSLPTVSFFKFLNNVRFGSVDGMSLFAEMKEMDLGYDRFDEVVFAASKKRKYDLLRLIKNESDFGRQWRNVTFEIRSEHLFFALIEIYSEAEKEAMFLKMYSINILMKFYDLDRFECDPVNSRAVFSFILLPEFSASGFPLSFDFSLKNTPENKICDKMYLSRIIKAAFFMQRMVWDEEAILRLLTGYKQATSLGFADSGVLYAKSTYLKTILKSELLMDMIKAMNLKFHLDNPEFANLLEAENVAKLRGIVFTSDHGYLLCDLKFFKQFRNLEYVLDINIAELLMTRVIPRLSENLRDFFKCNTALRYWLKSPDRDRMSYLKIKHSLFLKLLVKEVDLVDAEFLISLLNQ